MVMVLLQWCYIALVSFLTGFAVLAPFEKKNGYRVLYAVSYMMAGLVILTVYAEYFSLFGGVGVTANLLVVLADLAALLVHRRRIGAFLRERRRLVSRGEWILFAFLTVLFAYGSSRGYLHSDTGLYHAQSIRWIEEYGVVPGLANLHSRFGYNSAAFSLCALFGGAGLTRYPMHDAAGFFALLCAIKCTGLLHLTKKEDRRVRLSDFLSVGCIFYLVAVFRELVSPASDYFAMLLLFFLTLNWVELWERKEKRMLPYALLSEGLVFACTVKLSAAPMCLLVLYPAVLLILDKKYKQLAGWLAAGFLLVFPYLARNVLISGWLFYPFALFDWFPVDWKIEKGYANYDAREIQAYAKEIYDVAKMDQSFFTWFPHWFFAQTATDRLLVLAGWLCVPIGAGWMLLVLLGRGRRERWSGGGLEPAAFLLLEATALLSFFFWQFGAPLVRYGYFYVLFLPVTTVGCLYRKGMPKKAGFYGFVIFLVAFLGYRGYNLYHMVAEFWKEPYYLYQQDYGQWPAFSYEVDGLTIYVPTDRGQIGYDKFPSSPVVQPIELRKGTVRAGFRKKGSED